MPATGTAAPPMPAMKQRRAEHSGIVGAKPASSQARRADRASRRQHGPRAEAVAEPARRRRAAGPSRCRWRRRGSRTRGPMPNSSRRAKDSAGRPNCTIDVADCDSRSRGRGSSCGATRPEGSATLIGAKPDTPATIGACLCWTPEARSWPRGGSRRSWRCWSTAASRARPSGSASRQPTISGWSGAGADVGTESCCAARGAVRPTAAGTALRPARGRAAARNVERGRRGGARADRDAAATFHRGRRGAGDARAAAGRLPACASGCPA